MKYLPAACGVRRLPCCAPSLSCLALSVFALLLGCGSSGGSNGGSGGTAATPDFALSAAPASLQIAAGSSATATVSVISSNQFSRPVTVTVSGLMPGMTTSPASPFSVQAGTPQTVTFNAPGSSSGSSGTVSMQGVSGNLSHNATLAVSVSRTAAQAQPIGRTSYLRTDAATLYSSYLNANWVVFDSATNRFFVSDPEQSRITVVDSLTRTQIASIPVPGAYGIDLAPDHSVIYAGTLFGDVYAIDPVAMQVAHRYVASGIGPYGFLAQTAEVLADGRVVLLAPDNGIDGSPSFAVWNPKTNAITIYANSYDPTMAAYLPPETIICQGQGNIGSLVLSGGRTRIITGSIDTDGTVCSLDPATGQYAAVGGPEFANHLVATPDGKLVIESDQAGNQVIVRDAITLATLLQFPVAATGPAATLAISPDSRTLYVETSDLTSNLLYAYNLSTGAPVGWMPVPAVRSPNGLGSAGASYGPNGPIFDNTGLLAGPLNEGIGFIDTTVMRTGMVGTSFLSASISPATGPVSGGTSVQFPVQTAGTVAAVVFGGLPAQYSGLGQLNAVTPAAKPGPVDVYTYVDDGGVMILPEAFSYGPTILQVTPDAGTAEGGGIGTIYGYGFGPVVFNGTNTAPPDLQVLVAGQPAVITSFNADPYADPNPPFPLQAVSFRLPPGSAGASADISVTTSSGSTTVRGGLHFLPPLRQFPLAGASLAQGIYDSLRDVYYFSDANVIQVFSLTQGAWLTPISVPAAPQGVSHRLWGLALSHDGSQLAVSDANTASIYVIDPSTHAAKSFSVNIPFASSGVLFFAGGLAVSNNGNIYYTLGDYGGTGYDGFFKLDQATGKSLDYGVGNPGSGYNDLQLRAAISADESQVYFNDDGLTFAVNTATDKFHFEPIGQCCYGNYDLALSPSGALEASSLLYDSGLNTRASEVLNDREYLGASYVYGVKFNPQGTLLFQPSVNGIDVFDGQVGSLLTRIALPVALSQQFDALVADGKSSVLLAITGVTGDSIAEVDLSSLPAPAVLPYIRSGENVGHNAGASSQNSLQYRPAMHAVGRAPVLHRTIQLDPRKR